MAIFLNLVLREEDEDEPVGPTADQADVPDDREEWARIRHHRRRLSHGIGQGLGLVKTKVRDRVGSIVEKVVKE